MARRLKKIIHVNQHIIRANKKLGRADPPLLIRTYRHGEHAMEVKINGPCRVVYRPEKPLSCGARVWIETTADVEASGGKMNKNAKKWIKALESGEYCQCVARLTDGKGFCCLGVATDLYIRSKENLTKAGHHRLYWKYREGYGWSAINRQKEEEEGQLHAEVAKWLGLRTCDGSFNADGYLTDLTVLNDDKKYSFKRIAAVIKNEPLGLFGDLDDN